MHVPQQPSTQSDDPINPESSLQSFLQKSTKSALAQKWLPPIPFLVNGKFIKQLGSAPVLLIRLIIALSACVVGAETKYGLDLYS